MFDKYAKKILIISVYVKRLCLFVARSDTTVARTTTAEYKYTITHKQHTCTNCSLNTTPHILLQSTNIAESSVTIDDVVYVVNSGLVKLNMIHPVGLIFLKLHVVLCSLYGRTVCFRRCIWSSGCPWTRCTSILMQNFFQTSNVTCTHSLSPWFWHKSLLKLANTFTCAANVLTHTHTYTH